MEFTEKLQNYVSEVVDKNKKDFKDILREDIGNKLSGSLTPFELLFCSLDATLHNLSRTNGLDVDEFYKEIENFHEKISDIVFDLYGKLVKNDKERAIVYRKIGMMLITMGCRLYLPEEYLNDCVTKLIKENDFGESDV